MTRVALVSHGSPDYLIDIVTDGMIRLLGRENVHLGYNRTTPDGDHRIPQLFSGFDAENRFPLEEADCLVISNRSDFEIARDYRRRCSRPVALVDGEDDDAIRSELTEATLYAKREYHQKRKYSENIVPLPFAAIPEELPSEGPRDLPIFFRANPTDGFRELIAEEIRKLGLPMQVQGIAKAEYNRQLSSSLVGVSVRGAGWDTYRYWETPYFGAALFSQRHPLVIPGDFEDGVEAEFFDDAGDFTRKLKRLLDDPARTLALGARGREACRKRHLSVHRAERLLALLL